MGLTKDELQALMKAVATGVKGYVETQLEPVRDRVARLEVSRGKSAGVAWHGTWSHKDSYPEGALATLGGSLWVATAHTVTRPGAEGSEWTLVVKKGDYGKGDRNA